MYIYLFSGSERNCTVVKLDYLRVEVAVGVRLGRGEAQGPQLWSLHRKCPVTKQMRQARLA